MLFTFEAYRVRGMTSAPYTIFGRNTSMPYFAWPFVLAGMSSAGIDLPMILYRPGCLILIALKSSG